MPRTLFRSALAWLVALPLLAGCGASGPAKARVTGTVTLDGQPLATGTILFYSTDQSTSNSSGAIKAGAYAAEVYVGPMQVQIISPHAVGKRKLYDTPDSPEDDVFEERIPARYNAQTGLTADIKPGEQQLDFALKSQ